MQQAANMTNDACVDGEKPRRAVGRPRQFTEEDQREKRRVRAAKWNAENRGRRREITRESMKRAATAKAVAEGREPGRVGRPAQFTPEEKKAKRLAKAKRYYWENLEKSRSEAAARERQKRADKKAGTYDKACLPRLTDDERRASEVAFSALRRARIRNAGGTFTKADIEALRVLQKGKCTWCLTLLGKSRVHVDHYLPLALGGSNDRTNLRLLHEKCNLAKAAHHPIDHGLRSGLLCW